jgi:hypothetical protein
VSERPSDNLQRLKVNHATDQMPSALKTAEEAAEAVRLAPERLKELADAFLIPHYRIENGEPLFQVAECRRWIANNLLQRCNGMESLEVLVVSPAPIPIADRPDCLIHIDGLRQLPFGMYGPGVYFLCKEKQVVYVGQSVNPIARINTHWTDKKEFDAVFFLPVPISELNRTEAKFIHALKPPLNASKNGKMIAPMSEARAAA